MSLSVIPKIECVESRENYARFVAEPLEKGFGVTLGNAMRRVLLGHLPGAAVTHVRIEGIQHEFTAIPHVKEDAVEFLLNVKGIRLKALSDRPGKLMLDVVGEGRVCAADISPSSDFEIVNPELYLATLDSPDARLFVEFDVDIGTGYREADSAENQPLGVIPLDSIFTPTRKVNYHVEPLHVRSETGHERLIMEVWTDGTIDASDAMSGSAGILASMLNAFVNYGSPELAEMEKDLSELAISEEQYNMPVEQLTLSVRTMNCLRRGNITTVGELISKGEKGLLALRNFGQKSKVEIEERLNELGLSLNPKAEQEDAASDEAESSEGAADTVGEEASADASSVDEAAATEDGGGAVAGAADEVVAAEAAVVSAAAEEPAADAAGEE
ncbi:MAG: DNA-directed RNA polymerase subunit alpha [Dehalococcoidales bacterium]